MPDFSYSVGVEVDSSGIDSFIQRVRGLASSVNFGGSFQLPSGVTASGPGISAGGVANFTSGPQAVAFANATRVALDQQLQQLRGQVPAQDYRAAKREADAVANALAAGARRFEQVLSTVKGPVGPSHLANARAESQRVIDESLADFEKREIKNAKQREARAAKRAADQQDAAAKEGDEEAQARREATKAHRREAQAAKRSADDAERAATIGAQHDAQKALEKRRAARAARQAADAETPAIITGRRAGGAAPPPPPPPPPRGPGPDDDEPDPEKQQRVKDAQRRDREAADETNAKKKKAADEKADAQLVAEGLEARRKELQQLRVRASITGQATELDREIARAKAEVLLAEQRQARLEREQNQAVFEQARQDGFFNVGTRTQRLQAAFHSRGGQVVDPLGEKTLGSLVGTRIFQASSFALGGLAFYGALQVIRETLQETEKLEREFFVVQGQIERTFGDRSAEVFDRFKDRVRDISQATGQLGSEVAFVARQLAAAFVDQQPQADESKTDFQARQSRQFDLALRNAEQAFKFAEVTNLDPKEITDSLTALGLSFPELDGNFNKILDSSIALEEKFGVLGGQIVTFAADLAPLAANLGFTAEQLTELGAVAQKFSGRSGGQLAEQFGRILTDLPSKAPDIISLFAQTPQLADLSKGLADAFVQGNMEQVLEFILQAASRVQREGLDPNLVNRLSETVAGRREGASFAAILRQPDELLTALQTENADAAGAVDERWRKVHDSLIETMERLKRAVEQLAEAILSAGLADAFKLVATFLTNIATAAGSVIRFFDRLNDATGGLVGTFGGFYIMLKSVDALLRTMATSRVLGLLLPGGARVAQSAVTAGGSSAAINFLRTIPASIAGASGGQALTRAMFLGGVGSAGLRHLLGNVGARAAGWAAGGSLLGFGGAGATVAGLAAPAMAAFTTIEARRQLQNLRSSVRDQGDLLRIQAQSSSFRELFSGLQVGDTDTRFNFLGLGGIPGTQRIGRWALGGSDKLPENIVRDVFLQRAGPEGLSAALSALSGEEFEGAQADAYAKALLEVEKALGGDEEANLEGVVRFLEATAESRGELADLMGGAMDDVAAVEEAANEVSQGSSGPQFQQLLTALAGGRTTPEAVRNALQVAIEPLEVLAQAAADAGDYTAYLTQMESIAQLREAADKGISQYIANTISFAEEIRGIFGESTPETRIATATRILEDPNITDPDTRLKALQDLQNARNEAFEARLRAARNERERLDILAEGPGVDPLAQAEAIYQQVAQAVEARLAALRQRQAQNNARPGSSIFQPFNSIIKQILDPTTDIENMEDLTREQIALISEMLIQDIKTYGEGAVSIRLALLRARAEELRMAISYTGRAGGDTEALEAQRAAIIEQIGAYEALEASGLDPTSIVVPEGGLSPEQEQDRQRREREYARDRKLAIINRARAYAAGDPVREAQLAQQAARVSLDFARSEFGPDSVEAINAEAELISARMQARSAAKELALAQIAVAQAWAAGDPVAEANLSIQAAQVARAYATGPVEALQAEAQLIAAIKQRQEAYDDIAMAELELSAAQARNPYDQAQAALRQADLAIAQARGTAERLRAEAQRIQAQESLADVIRDIAQSQYDLAIAIAEAGGDAITASQKRIEQIQAQLNYAVEIGDDALINRTRAELVSAQRANYDAILDKQRSDVDFALQMDQITTQQAIQAYQALLSIPTNTEEQNRELMLAIKNLKEQAGQEFQFNLPTQLGLPTAYEARRFVQGETSGYNDNRTITVTVNAETNASPDDIATAVVSVIGEPNRSGITPRRY